jgi:hypothetical protein
MLPADRQRFLLDQLRMVVFQARRTPPVPAQLVQHLVGRAAMRHAAC